MKTKVVIGFVIFASIIVFVVKKEQIKESKEENTISLSHQRKAIDAQNIPQKPKAKFILRDKPEKSKKVVQSKVEVDEIKVVEEQEISPEADEKFHVIFNAEEDYEARYLEVQKLSRNLNEPEVDYLIEKLHEIEILPDDSLPDFSVGNEVLTKMLEQHEIPKQLGNYIKNVVNNDHATEIWRNYSLQHYHLYAERLLKEEPKSEELNQIKQTYLRAMEKQGTNLPGTALLGMNEMRKIDDNFKTKELRMLSYKTLYGNALPSVKISAYQILVEMKDPSLMKLDFKATQKLMGVEEGETVAMLSVINAYCKLGGDDKKTELRRLYSRSTNQIVRNGLKVAIEKML